MEVLALDRGGNLMDNKVSMRDKIAQLAFQEMGQGGGYLDSYDAADEIMAALPSMVVPLVWEDSYSNYLSGDYALILFEDGFLVDFRDQSLGHGYTPEDAKAAAQAHHVAQIMAAFVINA